MVFVLLSQGLDLSSPAAIRELHKQTLNLVSPFFDSGLASEKCDSLLNVTRSWGQSWRLNFMSLLSSVVSLGKGEFQSGNRNKQF